jgi:hypothetical protein
LILGLLYFAQVVIGHVIFFVTNFNVPSQAVHVKITAIEGPVVFLILLYLWIRSRPFVVHTSPGPISVEKKAEWRAEPGVPALGCHGHLSSVIDGLVARDFIL